MGHLGSGAAHVVRLWGELIVPSTKNTGFCCEEFFAAGLDLLNFKNVFFKSASA
jgi:hypothetical protein